MKYLDSILPSHEGNYLSYSFASSVTSGTIAFGRKSDSMRTKPTLMRTGGRVFNYAEPIAICAFLNQIALCKTHNFSHVFFYFINFA